MKKHLLVVLSLLALAFTLSLGACAVEPDEAPLPTDETAAPSEPATLDEIPAELSLISALAVPAGCSSSVNCVGTKTCGAWSPYTACAPRYQACTEQCGFPTRSGCVSPGTFEPQNRTRSCVMRATGQTCVETDYRVLTVSCPFGG